MLARDHSPPSHAQLDIYGNPAPVSDGIKAAMVQSLPWSLLRAHHSVNARMLLDGCKEENLLLDT